jgi:F420-dependent methylenetetrahydromethanopterin dehydrogenase
MEPREHYVTAAEVQQIIEEAAKPLRAAVDKMAEMAGQLIHEIRELEETKDTLIATNKSLWARREGGPEL